jgi:hypothetical protein
MIRMQRNWTPQEGKLPALSIRQPFASAIILGYKSIELRTWRTAYRGPLVIASSALWWGDVKLPGRVSAARMEPIHRAARNLGMSGMPLGACPTSAILGVALLVGCRGYPKEEYEALKYLHRSDAPWNPSVVGWHFDRVYVLPEPILNVRGTLGLFPVDAFPYPSFS